MIRPLASKEEAEVVFAEVSGGKNLASSRIFELHYRVRNICQLPRMRKQNVTIAGPSHKMRPSSPARAFTSQQCLYPVETREIGKELQLAGLELCRETFHEETP